MGLLLIPKCQQWGNIPHEVTLLYTAMYTGGNHLVLVLNPITPPTGYDPQHGPLFVDEWDERWRRGEEEGGPVTLGRRENPLVPLGLGAGRYVDWGGLLAFGTWGRVPCRGSRGLLLLDWGLENILGGRGHTGGRWTKCNNTHFIDDLRG